MFKGFSIKSRVLICMSSILLISMFLIQVMLIIKVIETSLVFLILDFAFLATFAITSLVVSREVSINQKREDLKKKNLESILINSALMSRSDNKGNITYVNDLFCKISGYKQHELLGKNHRILGSPIQSKSFWKSMYDSVLTHKSIWNEVVTNTKKSGESYISDSWILGEFDDKGRHEGYLYIQHDLTDLYNSLEITKLKEIELTAIMSGINKSSAIIEFCSNGFIISANDKFLNLSGYSKIDEISGKHHSIFMEKSDTIKKEYEEFWIDLKNGEPKSGEFQKIKKDGTYFWINCTYNPIIDSEGKIVKILQIANDISNSITQKIELERKNAYLEHAAKILRHDMHSGINTYIPRGISSLERRIYKVAMELGIDEDKLDDILKVPMRLLKEGLSHSQRVYEGVKEFTNLVKKDAHLDTIDSNLTSVLKDYLKSTAYSSQVELGELGEEKVNPSLFCTALDNLIRNGLKYNDSDSKVVKIYKRKNSIIIEDNGRGMTISEFEEYSKPYSRKTENSESGSGLGLNICIAIVKEHGWRLEMLKFRKGTKLQISFNK